MILGASQSTRTYDARTVRPVTFGADLSIPPLSFPPPRTHTSHGSYDICFVIEWLSEMAPLLKYLLGLEHLDASPRNVLATGGPDWGHGRTDFVAELGRKRALERSSTTSHASKLLTKEQLARLREVHSWDVKLYRVCQRSAAALAKKHLFLPYVRHHL